ncbi:MAG: GIY-YIG nuclease family protein [Elusimicrobiota bacterium]
MADDGGVMYSVYVLVSLKNTKRYIGCTGKSVEERLSEHNAGGNRWTRQNKPFKIFYIERYNLKESALKREKFLKSGQGRKYLDRLFPGSSMVEHATVKIAAFPSNWD